MLNHTEMTVAMRGYLNNAIHFMKKKGYILPAIVVFNKGEPLNIEVSHKQILCMLNSEEDSDLGIPGSENTIYKVGISFKLDEDYRDRYMALVAKEIASRYNPDAIATITACLYRGFASEEELKKSVDIQKDPEAFRVIYMSYFLRDEGRPNYLCVPYTKREKENLDFEDDEEYIISSISTSWNTGLNERDLLIPNPYK